MQQWALQKIQSNVFKKQQIVLSNRRCCVVNCLNTEKKLEKNCAINSRDSVVVDK